MADVLVLSDRAAAREQVLRAARMEAAEGAAHLVRAARSWAELFALASGATLGVAYVDPYLGGPLAAAEIQRLRGRFPALEVVAYGDFSARPADDPFSLALLGVRAVVAEGSPGEVALLRRVLADALNHTPLEALLERLGEVLPGSILRWLEPVLRSPVEPRTVPELARRAGCSARTLRRTLAAAELPTPEQLLAWRRLLHAARLLEDAGRSVESVARALHFSSGAALRKSLKGLTGLRPRDLAARGGLAVLGGCFLRACGHAEADLLPRARSRPFAHPWRPPPAAMLAPT